MKGGSGYFPVQALCGSRLVARLPFSNSTATLRALATPSFRGLGRSVWAAVHGSCKRISRPKLKPVEYAIRSVRTMATFALLTINWRRGSRVPSSAAGGRAHSGTGVLGSSGGAGGGGGKNVFGSRVTLE